MRKARKLIVLAMVCVMLLGTVLTVSAAPTATCACGKTMTLTSSGKCGVATPCIRTCDVNKYFYKCSSCGSLATTTNPHPKFGHVCSIGCGQCLK